MSDNLNHKEAIKCILWGGYGWGNVGDELTLAVALHDMQKRFGETVAILSPVPGYTKALFPEVDVIYYTPVAKQPIRPSLSTRILKRLKRHPCIPEPRYNVGDQIHSETSKQWAETIKKCEMLYLVGGGYLTDLFDVESFILPVKLAGYFGVPVETAPLGIGPFNHPWNVKRLKDALADAKVRVRDVDSQRICRGCGIPAELRKDDGFRVSEVMEIQHGNAKTSPLIGVNFYHQHGGIDRDREATWWRELLLLLKTNGARIEGFCFHNSLPSDFSQTVQLFEAAGLPAKQVRFPDWDFRDACRRLTDYDVIVTSRFHAVVIAGALEIPAIAVANGEYYDSKMTAACEGQARSRAIDLNNMQPAQVAQFI